MSFWQIYGEAAKTALGFFWKSGWAFVFGYAISAMIQAFVPKNKLSRHMGKADFKSVSMATIFGAASSSCSFAALAAARALVQKGAHFTAAVAFMFASTNLVIELGVLILIFLGWQYLLAEVVGGLVLIMISSVLIGITYPGNWIRQAKKKVSQESDTDENFNWRKRIRSRKGWFLVGQKFGDDWLMVWEEILIGFTIAGFMAVLVPTSFWTAIFMTDFIGDLPRWLIALENAAIAPFVAAATFIGSMGNIPLATVLNAHGVLFTGIMGFVYSDLMVPPLVRVNATYYGRKMALYIAGIMYVSVVATALILNVGFGLLDIVPQGRRAVSEIAQFGIDYTFWMNLVSILVVGTMIQLRKRHGRKEHEGDHQKHNGLNLKRMVAFLCIVLLASGMLVYLLVN